MVCSLLIDGVGLNAALHIMGIPLVIPPRIPPQLFVFVYTFPSFTVKESLHSEPLIDATPKPAPKPTPKPVPTWPCPKCGERNNINAKSCIECGEIRPEQFSPKEKPKSNPQEQSKVWKCPKCGEMNNVRYCVSCGEARPKEVVVYSEKNTQPSAPWTCPYCGGINNPAAKACIECGEPRIN